MFKVHKADAPKGLQDTRVSDHLSRSESKLSQNETSVVVAAGYGQVRSSVACSVSVTLLMANKGQSWSSLQWHKS